MIQDIIEEGEKEFIKRFASLGIDSSLADGYGSAQDYILDWHKERQHKLLQSIVEEIEGMKDNTRLMSKIDEKAVEQTKGYITALDSLKAKLTTNIKE